MAGFKNPRMNLVMALMLLAVGALEATYDFETNGHDVKRMTVKRGARAFLPCGGMSVVKIGDFMTWFRGNEVIATYRIDPDMPSPSKLLIKEVKNEDAGTYRCRVISIDGPAKDHFVEVNVLAPPVNVSIRTDNNDNFEAGSPRVLACVVYGCVSTLNVTWYLGDTMLRPNVYKEVNRGNFTVSSLTFVPSLTDNGKDLVCKATSRLMRESFTDRVTVSVGHRPLCIDDGFKTIGAVQGESETLVCMVESDPEPEQFIWTFSDGRTVYTSSKKVSGHRTRYSSTLVWVPKDDDYGPLYCRGSNRFGEQKQPCTFSVINGGPPTMPECDIHWEDQETLVVKCDKNWDGGRPQTIHLEVKSPEGTRKVSRKGNELKVNSLRRGSNFTLELYATNSRGRSLSLQVALPRPPQETLMYKSVVTEKFKVNVPAERSYSTNQSTWVVIMSYVIYALLIMTLFSCCIAYYLSFCRRILCCYQPNRDVEMGGSFHREEEMTDLPCSDRIAPNKRSCQVPLAEIESSSSSEFHDAGYIPMCQPHCLEYVMEEGPAVPKRCIPQVYTPTKQRPMKNKMAIEHYFV